MSILLYHSDCFKAFRQIPSESVALVTVDPPFNLGRPQTDVKSGRSYNDAMPEEEYLDWLLRAVKECKRVLTPNGTIYLHLSEKISYKVRFLIMDKVFGEENWLNTVVWSFDYGGRGKRYWPRKHEPILVYTKDPKNHVFNWDDIDRIPYMAPDLVGPEKAARGKNPTAVWWETVVPTMGKDRVQYPNQKPIKIYKRMILASSNPGDTVLDFCAGSGTSGAAAAEVGRNAILIDSNPAAIEVMEKRFTTAGISYRVERPADDSFASNGEHSSTG